MLHFFILFKLYLGQKVSRLSYPVRKIKYEPYERAVVHRVKTRPVVKQKRKPKRNFFVFLLALLILAPYCYYVCPYNFKHWLRPLFINRILNRNIKFNAEDYISNTNKYIYNSHLLDKKIIVNTVWNKEVADIKIIREMIDTKQKLLELSKNYPKLEPSIYVWEYSTGSGLDINSRAVYPSASIIKIPIAYELMRLIDTRSKTQSPIFLDDKRVFTELFRTSGSGYLQKTKANNKYTIDYLANIMIAYSDNSATNMLLYEIGGVENFNRQMRNLGFKTVSMSNWLPDLEGTNKISAYEISKLLYNIDNPKIINPKYKTILKEYLGNTRNTHLLKEKLPEDIMVLHKTGNIGSMLGDAGIIYTNNGKKYIVTVLIKRPHNDNSATSLIQEISRVIYEDIIKL